MSLPALPTWIVTAHEPAHLSRVLQTLRERESKRDNARNVSRQQAKSNSPSSSTTRHFSRIRIPKLHPHTDHTDHYAVKAGSHQDNEHKNRYLHLEPYDRTRVVLGERGVQIGADVLDSNNKKKAIDTVHCSGRYLNANWVLERFGGKWWIATQAPMPNTAHAFLSVMLQPIPHLPCSSHVMDPSFTSRVRTVVQLTQNIESGRRKAHAYFPSDIGRSLIVPPEMGCSASALKVTLLDTQIFEAAHCIRSTVSVVPIHSPPELRAANVYDDDLEVDDANEDEDAYGEEETENRVLFHHLLYTSWPDHGVPEPENRASMLAFVKLVDDTNRDLSLHPPSSHTILDPDPPMIVGCSAGIGRTGSFIAISSLLRDLGILPPPIVPTTASVLPVSPLGALPKALAEDKVAQEVDALREQRPGMVQREEQVLLIYETLLDAFSQHTDKRD